MGRLIFLLLLLFSVTGSTCEIWNGLKFRIVNGVYLGDNPVTRFEAQNLNCYFARSPRQVADKEVMLFDSIGPESILQVRRATFRIENQIAVTRLFFKFNVYGLYSLNCFEKNATHPVLLQSLAILLKSPIQKIP